MPAAETAPPAGSPEPAISEAAHLYRDIFEHCSWGVFQSTPDGSYLTANPALARLYGYDSPQQLLSRLTNIGGQLYTDPDRRAAFVAAMREHGVLDGFESQVYRRDGSVIWIVETCREVRNSAGQLLYYEGTVQDITQRKRAEAELREAHAAAEAANRAVQAVNQTLERRVAERTAQLGAMQDELLARERLSTLGELTATVAHELRNPLSVIRNAVYVVRESEGDWRERALQRIERSIGRCDRIIADLLDYAQIRELRRRPIRLDDWLDALLAERRVPEGFVVARHFGAGKAHVALDPDRFRCVIVNVLDNAIQALQEQEHGASPRRLSVATLAAQSVEILIEDTGPGMTSEVLAKVFDPLFSTKSFGTGLGLPTAKQIVAQHGGEITLSSEVGRGTSVRIQLPRAERQA